MNTRFVMYAATVLFFMLFVRNFFGLVFRLDGEKVHRQRMKELTFNNNRIGQSKDAELKSFLTKVTSPIIDIISPRLKPKTLDKLQRELEYVGWSRLFQAEQFKALQLILMGVGLFLAPLAYAKINPIFGVVIFGATFFLPNFLLHNEIKNKQDRIFNEFPEFIQLVQGYLVAEMPLTEAIQNTIEYVNEDWQEYLTEFVVNSNTSSVGEALDRLQYRVNNSEVSELLSLIRVSLDQGINVKDSFENQTEKVKTMQMDVMMGKIEKRKMMTLIIQGPLLLTIIVAFGLPTLKAMTTIGG